MHFHRFHRGASTVALALVAWTSAPSEAWGADAPPSTESEVAPEEDRRRFFVGTSLFMAFNLLPEPPSFFQLNVGWRPTERDALSLEAITWTYHAPLGIQWGPKFGDPAFDYPGRVRDVGVGVAYQRFWWEGLYTQVHAVPFVHTYYDEHRDKIQTGFLLFTTLRAGYHIGLFRDRVFVEPSVASTWWPIETNVPAVFEAENDRWSSFFLFEPGLHAGVNF